MPCKIAYNREKTGKKYLTQLKEMNYSVHTPVSELWDKIKKFDVTNNNCGHRFQAQGGNILNGMSVCGVCGPSKRIEKALNVYKQRYGKNYDLAKKEDYYKKVMALSRKNFIGKSTRKMHLDHIVSIDWGFKNQAPVELIADAENLRLLSAKDNIAKGAMIGDFSLLKKLCAKHNHPLDITVNDDALNNPIYGLLLKRLPNLFSAIDTRTGVLRNENICVKIIDVTNPTDLELGSINIFSDEIQFASNSDRRLRIIAERLLHKCNRHTERVYARKCSVKELDALTASRFLDANHFQGRGQSRIKLGLYQQSELVAVMTFGKPRFAKGYDWELIRYATCSGKTIVGGASKLLSYFRKKYAGSIITYSDRRWGSGNVYSAMGFTHIGASKPNYWWVKDGRRISRYQTQLDRLQELIGSAFNPALSERDNMNRAGWTRVQDLGNDIFVLA